jgi:hypothetical protein
MTRQGELDLDPARWPDPAAMNRQLHSMGINTLLSVWPHFSAGTRYYDMLREKGWLIHSPDGTPDSGGFKDVIGPNIDTTNPDAAKWWWESIRDRYIKPDGFDYLWLDETEPDIDPAKDVFSVGSGSRYYNVYPLFQMHLAQSAIMWTTGSISAANRLDRVWRRSSPWLKAAAGSGSRPRLLERDPARTCQQVHPTHRRDYASQVGRIALPIICKPARLTASTGRLAVRVPCSDWSSSGRAPDAPLITSTLALGASAARLSSLWCKS